MIADPVRPRVNNPATGSPERMAPLAWLLPRDPLGNVLGDITGLQATKPPVR
jgi:hypothetical protein